MLWCVHGERAYLLGGHVGRGSVLSQTQCRQTPGAATATDTLGP
jgi:hypothetical protein